MSAFWPRDGRKDLTVMQRANDLTSCRTPSPLMPYCRRHTVLDRDHDERGNWAIGVSSRRSDYPGRDGRGPFDWDPSWDHRIGAFVSITIGGAEVNKDLTLFLQLLSSIERPAGPCRENSCCREGIENSKRFAFSGSLIGQIRVRSSNSGDGR